MKEYIITVRDEKILPDGGAKLIHYMDGIHIAMNLAIT